MKRSRPRMVGALLMGLLPLTAAHASFTGDNRPLPPLTSHSIPAYSSVEAFLNRPGRGHLLDAARPAATAGRLALPGSSGMVFPAGTPATGGTGPEITGIQRAPNGTIRWLEGRLGRMFDPSAPAAEAGTVPGMDPPHARASREVAASFGSLLGLADPRAELRLIGSKTDALGYEHHRFQQVYNGVPVWARDLYIHARPDGVCHIINGTIEPTPAGMDVLPAVPADSAVESARTALQGEGRWSPADEATARLLGYTEPDASLVIYPMADGPRLAWEVRIRPNILESFTYFVDARTGESLHRIQEHCEAGFFDATANDLNNVSRTVRTYQHTDSKYYMIWDLANLNQTTSQLPGSPVGGIITLDARNTDITQDTALYIVGSLDNTWLDKSSISAYNGAKVTFDYYGTTHTRKAIDDLDSTIISVVNVTKGGQSMENAYWNGRAMFYGNGGTTLKPLAGGQDVISHEITHGVIQNTSNLVYESQSGALNESFADVFGVMVDRDDFMIGEDVMQPGKGTALRDLLNPANTAMLTPQPDRMSSYIPLPLSEDNGGVHINSGIPNRAAALLINAIGRAKAEKIYYRALTTYLTRSSQFIDCRNAVEAAAKDLYGTGAEVTAVQEAFNTVGITTGTVPGGGTTVPPVTGGHPWIGFMLSDGTLGLYDPANGQAGTFTGDAAKARADETYGDRAQITTARDGVRLWFVNATRHLSYIDLNTFQVSTFNTLKLYNDGDLWNASISADENFVALVSAYAKDPALYIFDGAEIGRIVLEPETTQDGIKDTSILFPDVVSWSPDMAHPKIAFDALHEITVDGNPAQYYGIAEINFASGRTYDLVPGQPASISIGNITYSNTNPASAAINLYTSVVDILLADLETATMTALGMYNYKAGDIQLVDCERPTFSPDDGLVCFTSTAAKAMVFHDTKTGNKTFTTFNVPVFNPRWFVQGGTLPITLADAGKALRIACGLAKAESADLTRLNLDTTGAGATRITMSDALRIARKAGKID